MSEGEPRVSFADRSAQGQAELLGGLLLLADCVQRGWIETGPFTVNPDQVYASLALLAADESVVEPPRDVMVREAIRLMGFRDGLAEEDYEVATVLLSRATLEWPA